MLNQNHLAGSVLEAILYVERNLFEDWLAQRREYPVVEKRHYCPQCLYDLSRKPQTFGASPPKSYSRGRDVRRHWKLEHGEMGYLDLL
jgi:hypothetical protein